MAIADTLPVFIHAPHFDVKLLTYALHSVHHQVEHLRTVYAGRMNHRLSDLSDVFSSGIAFPEFRKSAEWKAEAAELLPKIMFDDIYEDGMNKEVVFSYHSMYIGLFCQAYRLFKDHGFGDRISPEFYQRLVKMADIYTHAIFPDFSLPQFGDGWKNRRNPGRLLVDTLGFAKADLPYAEFMGSNGTKGTPPRNTSRAFPVSGFYFFRSAWDAQAVFMAVKSTEKGEFHNQHDNGTFEFYAKGRNFMIDSGCYIYGSQSEEERRLREWFRSSKVHQTMTLDDADAQSVPRFVFWKETPSVEALVIENAGYAGLTHRRTILFVEKRWVMIHDEGIGSASGEVAIHFQFVPCDYRQDGTGVGTRFPTGPNLTVRSFPCGSRPRYQQEEGWISYEILKRESRPAWKWAVDKQADQKQVDFLTVLIPTDEGGKADATAASVTTGPDGRVYAATVDGVAYRICLDAVKGGLTCERR